MDEVGPCDAILLEERQQRAEEVVLDQVPVVEVVLHPHHRTHKPDRRCTHIEEKATSALARLLAKEGGKGRGRRTHLAVGTFRARA